MFPVMVIFLQAQKHLSEQATKAMFALKIFLTINYCVLKIN